MEKREHGFQGKQAGEAPWTLTRGSCTPGQGDGGKDRSPGDRQRSSEVNRKQSGGNAVWACVSHSKHGPEAPSSVPGLTGALTVPTGPGGAQGPTHDRVTQQVPRKNIEEGARSLVEPGCCLNTQVPGWSPPCTEDG